LADNETQNSHYSKYFLIITANFINDMMMILRHEVETSKQLKLYFLRHYYVYLCQASVSFAYHFATSLFSLYVQFPPRIKNAPKFITRKNKRNSGYALASKFNYWTG